MAFHVQDRRHVLTILIPDDQETQTNQDHRSNLKMINKPDVFFSHRSEESYAIERVIVIGKSGFVGSELLLSLAAIDIDAVGIGRDDIDLTSPLVKL